MKRKEKFCAFDFGQSEFNSQVDGTQMQLVTRFFCAYARTMVHPTACMFARKCKYQRDLIKI